MAGSKRVLDYDARCPQCGAAVVSVASKCKICGSTLAKAVAAAHSAQKIESAPRGPEQAAGNTPGEQRKWPLRAFIAVLALGGAIAATAIALRYAEKSSKRDEKQLIALAPVQDRAKSQTPGSNRPDYPIPFDLQPPAQNRQAPGQSFDLQPGNPVDPFGMPNLPLPGSGDIDDLDRLLRSLDPSFGSPLGRPGFGLGRPGAGDPAIHSFTSELVTELCSKVSQCDGSDPAIVALCPSIVGSLLGSTGTALLGQSGCKLNRAKAAECMTQLKSLDCNALTAGGGASMMSAIMTLSSCSEALCN